MYEISIVMRDNVGNELLTPDGRVRRKLFIANTSDELADLWARNGGRTRKNKKKNTTKVENADKPEKGNVDVQNREEAPEE